MIPKIYVLMIFERLLDLLETEHKVLLYNID